ncbi:ion channel domain-containing protein [Ditylenchus destructor]|nr:ion channel domain-containing protein [Ditylenchus destructor]
MSAYGPWAVECNGSVFLEKPSQIQWISQEISSFAERSLDENPFQLERKDSLSGPGTAADRTISHNIIQYLKILLPHVGLNVLLLTYIMFGALVFIFIESQHELENRKARLRYILEIYEQIINEGASVCSANSNSNKPLYVAKFEMEQRIRPFLNRLSQAHEYDDRLPMETQVWSDKEESLRTKWTFASAALYALTVCTSTGYDHLTATTDAGRIFTMLYGLLGIPLMFITAADIGKFLSGWVIRTYCMILNFSRWISALIKHYFIDVDEEEDRLEEMRRLRERRRRIRRLAQMGDEEALEMEEEEEKVQLPIVSYFALVVGYCTIGSLLFNSWERGDIWSFIHGVFFSFNTITTISLGNICVNNKFYLLLVICYVIIGLAVITASLDLCSSTLKRTFTKLHYFGRKIRGAKKDLRNVGDDIREAMKIMIALKRTRPGRERITLEDLKRFLEAQEKFIGKPYVPYNIHIFKWIEEAYAQYYREEPVPEEELPKLNFLWF